MKEQETSLGLNLTSLRQPDDYQECLVYSPCEGFMVATWKNLGDEPGFYLFATYEPLHHEQTLFWAVLPTPEDMSELCRQLMTTKIKAIKNVDQPST
ncbi:hypothetical protein [Pseudomonas sp. BGI-2]|uniref:hypothetical protein n=1 Tax=Pseudomonas sp. BGI-2 TaxID=2528211 RepID=UPI001034A312|nr:hypothetical protein [Pseudomonas sp. BGI-2]TBN49152.1 hypothetical protein EYC95_06315 [Pseudomonas sp. BGI-2]